VVPTLAIAALLAVAGTAGTYLPQSVAPLALPSSASPSPSESPTPEPVQDLPTTTAPTVGTQPSTEVVAAAPTRPQDALAAWAHKVATATGVPDTALRAYGYATLRLGSEKPGCHLAWTTLAAIGRVESNHGRANGATLQPDGSALPPIVGAALNGQGGLKSIPDTDHGRYDGDQSWDHAVGPMQFIPSTWTQYQVDGDNDGAADPNDINDAALAAANYLCAGGRDLATSGGWWGAVLSYNAIQQYAQSVFDAANEYGQRARSIA
jgi:membrane-bound lytic murein transglycosylase B